MSISKLRSILYGAARLFGDYSAVRRGTVGKRVARRLVGKVTGRGLSRVFRR